MADGIEQAAAAFDAVINTSPDRAPQNKAGPVEDTIFKNIGGVDADTEPKGGGDDDPEELIYADKPTKRKASARDSGEEDEEAGDGGHDESDPDAADDGDPDDPERDPDDPEEEEDPALNAELSKKVEVTVDGEPVEVTLKEALEGYVRTETFHRRMNQLDEAKKVIRRAAADAVQNYEYSMNVAQQMEAHMEQLIPKEPNWDEEFAKDPAQARRLQQYYEKANSFKTKLKGDMSAAIKKMAESQAAQTAAFAEEEDLKFQQMNAKYWTDPKRKVKDLTSMRKTALTAGFSEEEVSQVYDSRMLQILLKASKYDRMMAAKPKPVVRPQGKPISPGAGSARSRTAQKGVTSAMKRLNRTGSIDDAAQVFDQIIARR